MEQIFKIGSVSGASRAKKALQTHGVKGRITKTGDTKDGCAWGIAVTGREAETAARILRLEGVRYEAL